MLPKGKVSTVYLIRHNFRNILLYLTKVQRRKYVRSNAAKEGKNVWMERSDGQIVSKWKNSRMINLLIDGLT